MEKPLKSAHLQIVIAGRTNAGKSTLLNLIAGQDVAIISPVAGTTTDVVEKAMELRPLGPVLFLDTAGVDDSSALGNLRVNKSNKAFDRADVFLLVVSPNQWGEAEDNVCNNAKERNVKVIVAINNINGEVATEEFIKKVEEKTNFKPIQVEANNLSQREECLSQLRVALFDAMPEDFISTPPLLGDLVKEKDIVILIVPIDIQAPKGRIILPQMQSLRDGLDLSTVVITVKESEYPQVLKQLKTPPKLVVCDSQVVDLMVRETPNDVPCTTFSILFSRLKGDMILQSIGAAAIRSLRPNDKVLIAEACTHHASEDDIGRVKIPKLLAKVAGGELNVDVFAGRDYPENLSEYKLVVHCGSCMLNRRETLRRIELAKQASVNITNYGMAISECHNVLERVLSPFPEALNAYIKTKEGNF